MPFLVFRRGSFAVWDHLRSSLGIISGLGRIYGRGSFAALYNTFSVVTFPKEFRKFIVNEAKICLYQLWFSLTVFGKLQKSFLHSEMFKKVCIPFRKHMENRSFKSFLEVYVAKTCPCLYMY